MNTSEMLRAYADWLDAHPEAEGRIPQEWNGDDATTPFYVLDPTVWTAEQMAAKAKALGGRWDKSTDGTWFWLRREVVPGITYCLYTGQSAVCERVVTGTETVEVTDPEAPKVTVEREVVEWRCPDSLLAAGR